MNPLTRIDEKVSIGGQPSEADLAELKRQGVVTLVNLRRPGENNQPLSPDAEGEKARALGLRYVHIPVSSADMRPEQIDEYGKAVDSSAGPVHVHCGVGARAGIFALIHSGARRGLSADQVVAEAKTKGFDLSEMRDLVSAHLARPR
jgi:uncharacterized protein (TIGR01244 family)